MQAKRARNHLSAPLHQINVFVVIVNFENLTTVTMETFASGLRDVRISERHAVCISEVLCPDLEDYENKLY